MTESRGFAWSDWGPSGLYFQEHEGSDFGVRSVVNHSSQKTQDNPRAVTLTPIAVRLNDTPECRTVTASKILEKEL
jgi:hypothetical protein